MDIFGIQRELTKLGDTIHYNQPFIISSHAQTFITRIGFNVFTLNLKDTIVKTPTPTVSTHKAKPKLTIVK